MKQTERSAADYIQSLNMNGLSGRMLRMPAPKGKSREMLFVYGHHSTLERWWGVMQALNRYGAVTMPDLPGFGGMDSLYKRGDTPTIDALADYLAAFVKLRYRRKKVTIVGMSFGFVVATRMLQRNPELINKVDMFVSVVGFAHRDDFVFSKPRYRFYKFGAGFLSHRLTASLFRRIALNRWVLRAIYARTHNAKHKFAGADKAEFKRLMDFEVQLWHRNDVRTHWKTTHDFLTLDNCRKQIDLPVWHVSVKADRYFSNHLVEQHMRVIFTDFKAFEAKMDNHAPSVIASLEMAEPLLPAKLRRILAKS